MVVPSRREVVSYSRLQKARPLEHHLAEDADEITRVLRRANGEGRRVTVRAGGRSFDGQAINEDIVLDVSRLDRIARVDAERREVRTEASARWGAIFEATLQEGLIPHIMVTTRRATAAGTLASNCISRSSALYGHAGDHVLSLKVVTASGETKTCSRTEHPDLFRAVVGGFGYFGVVTEVTYDLKEVGARRRVKTVIDCCEGLDAFVERLVSASLNPEPYEAVYSVFSLRRPQRGAVLRSLYTDEPLGKQLHIYEPFTWRRALGEVLFVSSSISNALSHASYRHVFQRGPFVDDLDGYTFCMEGNERMKEAADRIGVTVGSIQHAYVLPTVSLLFFLTEAARMFERHDVYPNLLDALYLPEDDFVLSPSRGLPGVCASFVFEGPSPRQHERIAACLRELNDVCANAGGRLSLAKDVYATLPQMQRMYRHALGDVAALKAQYDPRGTLGNAFFDRTFGL
jgi:decaprenylphospho-beta-D-ribofuranose 2-oxidase